MRVAFALAALLCVFPAASQATPQQPGGPLVLRWDAAAGSFTPEPIPGAPILILSAAERRMLRHSEAGLRAVPGTGTAGGVAVDLDGTWQDVFVSVIDASGTLHVQCLDSEPGAAPSEGKLAWEPGAGRGPLARPVPAASETAATPTSGATILVVNLDGPGEGFNDPTAAVPVGGNSGTTVGAQRLIAFQAAADAWAAALTSGVTIRVHAQFDPLSCTSSSAVLGSAGPVTVHHDFAGAPFAGTWYVQALANKLAGADVDPSNDDITAFFNSAIGSPGCLDTNNWYYGLDHQLPASRIDLFAIVQHELGHGLGFFTVVNRTTGAKLGGLDDAYMRNLEDHSLGLTWPALTDAQRLASMTDAGDLHWIGPSASGRAGLFTAGTASGHLRMYAPTTLVAGSSVAHWDAALQPNELMEPMYVVGSTMLVTDELMTDIGWGAVDLGVTKATKFFTLAPCRVLDTRNANGPLGGPSLAPGAERFFVMAGACGIPSSARALSGNVTVTQPASAGYLALHPGDGVPGIASSISFPAGKTVANNLVLKVSPDGSGTAGFVSGAAGTVHVIFDVNGYYK